LFYQLREWWNELLRKEELRKEYEKKMFRREKLREQALARLSSEEIEALGLSNHIDYECSGPDSDYERFLRNAVVNLTKVKT
jgi:hypothetical protein